MLESSVQETRELATVQIAPSSGLKVVKIHIKTTEKSKGRIQEWLVVDNLSFDQREEFHSKSSQLL